MFGEAKDSQNTWQEHAACLIKCVDSRIVAYVLEATTKAIAQNLACLNIGKISQSLWTVLCSLVTAAERNFVLQILPQSCLVPGTLGE